VKKTTKLNDPWGHPYNYRFPGTHAEFDLYSYGAHPDQSKSDEKPPISNW
jgi:general secretion pathway protein G